MPSALINVMVGAARKAARRLVRDFGEVEQLQVSRKGPADFVSNADKMAEKTLVEELSRVRPNFGFLLEEGGEIKGKDPDHRWIVDPLDGTTNFLHGIPHFAISIGLEFKGDVIAGVVHAPATDEMFNAEKGGGAFLNGRRLRVSARERLSDCIFATGIPFLGRGDDKDLFQRQLRTMMDHTAGVRRFGSAALDLAWVAAGRYDGFWEQGLSPWDLAAGIVILREAGGLVNDMAGGDDMLGRGDVIAANAGIHGAFSGLLRDAAKSP